MPRFSILLPVYNGSTYLEESIGSVLNQSFTDFELIIIDDGSTDNSRKIAEKYSVKDGRIVLKYKDHAGLAETLNYGTRNSKGELIARIDADDRWFPDKLSVQERYFREYPEIFILGSSVIFIDASGQDIHAFSGFNNWMELKPEELRKKILRNNLICSSTLVFRREVFSISGAFNSSFQTSMDYDFLIRALKDNKGMVTREKLVEYRISNTMMTITSRETMIGESIRIRKKALGIYKPNIGIRILVFKDILGLFIGRLYYKITGRSKLHAYLR